MKLDISDTGKAIINTIAQSKYLQQALFDAGFMWPLTGNNYKDLSDMGYTDKPNQIYWRDNKIIQISRFSDIQFDYLPYPLLTLNTTNQ